jgi:uncharacterized membrane protein (DUF2068 family)
MTESENQRTIGASILAILTAQAGLLALFLSGSVWLQTLASTSHTDWGLKGVMMLLIGTTYLVMAYGLWSSQSWARIFSYFTLATVMVAGILNTMDDKVLDLGFALVFFMCCCVNFVIIGWFLIRSLNE